MAYTKQTWTDNVTPVDKAHMDHIEDGLVTADANATTAVTGKQNAISYGANPPASPADGDLWCFPADAGNGAMWLFRYRAASASAYKWEFVGGAPLWAALTDISTASGSWVASSSALTISRAGDYIATMSGRLGTASASTLFQASVRTRAGNEAICGELRATGSAVTDFRAGCSSVQRFLDCLVGDLVTACIRNGSADGTTGTLGYGKLGLTPIRVS